MKKTKIIPETLTENHQPKHIKDLIPDPQNARKHNPRNIGMIEKSLHDVGAARSIVIDENNVILAGNGVIEAAAAAGIENVRVIEATGNEIIAVKRSGLTDEQKKKLALFDNRTGELAEWNIDVLKAINIEIPLDDMFSEKELNKIFDIETPKNAILNETFEIVIECQDESQQAITYENLIKQGYKCRVLTL